jgi:hypothetical protein
MGSFYVIAAAAALAAGCGIGIGGSGSGADTPAVPFVAIQPEDARLSMAANDVKGKIGHEVNVDVDAELLKEHAPHLSIILADTLETISRGIDRARADRPAEMVKTCAALATLKIQLDERLREPRASVDTASGLLLLRVPNGVNYFATDQDIANAFANAQ